MAQISRRDFLKGSVATGMLGAVAATGLGCAPAQQTSAGLVGDRDGGRCGRDSSWRVAPGICGGDAIVDETVADIVVIGAGHAGTATARSAEEQKALFLLEALEEHYTIIGNDIRAPEFPISEGSVCQVDPWSSSTTG